MRLAGILVQYQSVALPAGASVGPAFCVPNSIMCCAGSGSGSGSGSGCGCPATDSGTVLCFSFSDPGNTSGLDGLELSITQGVIISGLWCDPSVLLTRRPRGWTRFSSTVTRG